MFNSVDNQEIINSIEQQKSKIKIGQKLYTKYELEIIGGAYFLGLNFKNQDLIDYFYNLKIEINERRLFINRYKVAKKMNEIEKLHTKQFKEQISFNLSNATKNTQDKKNTVKQAKMTKKTLDKIKDRKELFKEEKKEEEDFNLKLDLIKKKVIKDDLSFTRRKEIKIKEKVFKPIPQDQLVVIKMCADRMTNKQKVEMRDYIKQTFKKANTNALTYQEREEFISYLMGLDYK